MIVNLTIFIHTFCHRVQETVTFPLCNPPPVEYAIARAIGLNMGIAMLIALPMRVILHGASGFPL